MLESLLKWDRDTFVYLNTLGVEEYDRFWIVITTINSWIPLFITFFFFIFYKTKNNIAIRQTACLLGLVLFIITLTNLTKNAVARLRPNNEGEIGALIRILKSPTDYSFFSGHAASSFAITLLWYLFVRKKVKWAVIFFVWPTLFSLSRIFVGVHYPLDIIAGSLIGCGSALLFYLLYNQFLVKSLKYPTKG